ncbi:hypothetical protein RBB78_02600 [Tunturiibacter empetritectus]|uniref:hypothetical protein n=1 Tax=Tunturiibacter empetritectus TaxID=3069691 RepID=UPI003D9B9BCF
MGDKTKLDDEANDCGEDEGDGRPEGERAKVFGKSLNKKDEREEDCNEDQAIYDKVACSGGRGYCEAPMQIKRMGEAANGEGEEEQEELEDGTNDFFMDWLWD